MLTALQHTAPRAASAAMPSAAAAVPGPLAPPLVRGQQRQLMPMQQQQPAQQWRQRRQRAAVVALAAAAPAKAGGAEGHTALLHSLGEVGEVAPVHMPWLLRLAHIKSRITGGDSNAALQESARGLLMWKAALERGLVLDDFTIQQLIDEKDSPVAGQSVEALRWPEEPLRFVMVRSFSTLGVARFAQKYPAVLDALLRTMLEMICKYHKTVIGEVDVEERERDASGQVYMTAAELMEAELKRRGEAARSANKPTAAQQAATAAAATASQQSSDEDEEGEEERASWSLERQTAEALVAALVAQWQKPIDTLGKAGRAFDGLESLLGGARGGSFDLSGNIWDRKGWAEMDKMREKLEDLKELRDLVRSLGRGGGWGPLRRAPVQHLDMRGRPGLLRTTLEAQETRGLTRSDDLSRLLPSEAALLARGRTVRQAKLFFYAKMAEKGLATYERDGWGEFPTQINVDRREIRPTADRGPILLCVDTSGSMRGPREVVAKALALECMRAAKAQERGCYVFAFAGPQEVRELELNMDLKSVNNLLEFLEKVFNGGSDFNAPVQKCLDRLTDAKWANSDILLVSDGELRQPGPEIMRKLAGAKDKLGLRVHGLIVGSPEKRRADPAVLRGLCSHTLPSGKNEVLIHEFESWASVQAERTLQFDWDDAMGNQARREAGLRLEKLRQEEIRRRRGEARGDKKNAKAVRMPGKNTSTFE
ncbi:hypothetical protein COHA_005107 [Chlorella ohadii]|uniref:VWFA domain-containing protein n=1 Tax=Chlorella ohadii TaxID=2649997 RepID=A0AAD5DP21_9CHLO|nr:hypothetical protein COHA_005107 [Chlorella ohadii]